MTETGWRPVVAALGNVHNREVFAQIVLRADAVGEGLSPSRRAHALSSLTKAGLIREIDGRFVVVDDVFARVLAAAPRPVKRTGVDRFLTDEGRIDRYPASPTERASLLEHIVQRAVTPDEVLTEAELNARLERFTDDVAVLRRYLVDHDLLERTRSGSQYARC